MKLISRSELIRLQENQVDFLLLNVLDRQEFYEAHIPGSRNISVSEEGFLNKVKHLLRNKGRHYPIVTYCGGYHCSAAKGATTILTNAGYTDVSVYEGGVEDWSAAGCPISRHGIQAMDSDALDAA